MAVEPNGTKYNPFYRNVDGDVQSELNRRGDFYGSRVRSGRVPEGTKGFPDAEKLLWSYGKTAYAIVSAKGITLGTSSTRVMSDRKGNLTLYDSTRNQPKYPLLQSVELSNEGTIGSLLKGSFTFTVYPDISSDGFIMEGLEEAFFKPGNEVKIKYGWSVRDGGPNNGQLTGIIYNFDWSVNPDLSITAKCSVVSKATIAIGVSGEQTNPDAGGTQTDPLGQPIPDGDLAGVIERDVKSLGGVNNTSVSEGTSKYYPKSQVVSGKLDYYVIGMPMSLVDMPTDKLNQQQQVSQSNYQAQQKIADDKNAIVKQFEGDYAKAISDLNSAENDNRENLSYLEDGKTVTVTKGEYVDRAKRIVADLENRIRKEYKAKFPNDTDVGANDVVNQVKNRSSAINQPPPSGTSTPPQTTSPGPYGAGKSPPPIVQPVYYIKLGDLTTYINKVLEGTPLASDLFVIESNNSTQHLSEIVSSTPEEVYFPDQDMGGYGDFIPFKPGFLKDGGEGGGVNIYNILISTTTVIDVYRSFVKENQTSIEYKNITGFFDELIKKVNFASGEMYQLATQLLDPPKGGNGRAQLSIEDTNISKSTTDKVTPYGFYATIAKPILKSVSISCKPPAASAAAAYTQARGQNSKGQTDVRFNAAGDTDEFTSAQTQIKDQKEQFKSNGAGPTFSTGMKGNYAKYKRSAKSDPNYHWLNKVLYPIDLTLTIDGIDGIKFGDVIKTNLIPSRYTKENMVFVVTKIGHTIQNGVWETTINTKARIEPS